MISSTETRYHNVVILDYILHSQHIHQDTLTIPNVNTLPGLFKWQAQNHSNHTLFSFQKSPNESLTTLSYAESYERSYRVGDALSNYLPEFSVEDEAPVVGIWFERSIDLHLAILATTISGATWLPFDADVPATRVSACLADSKASVLLCDAAHYDAALEALEGHPECRLLTCDGLAQEVLSKPGGIRKLRGPSPHHTAYLIYTSGSTGTPKGIEIPHSAALTFALSERSVLQTSQNDIVWQGFSAAFDMFIEEVWVSIAGGAQLAIGSRAECQDVPSLGGANGVWARRGVTVVNAVPTLINIMTSLDDSCRLPPSVRLLNLGGEACPPALVNLLWTPSLRIINTYGPSETTVTATFQELFPNEPVTIGKPLPMYHAMILPILEDTQKERIWSPIRLLEGAEGELAIGGSCLGKGYVQRPTLTNEKFIPHPFPSTNGERLYRTGDRVRLDKDLNIVYLGRIDTQVKHRGFRIELGEIENVITAHPRVQTAAVILSTTTDRLEAYMVTKDGDTIESKELRDTLRHLPAYMQPEGFCFIPAKEMPRLPSGKINIKALQDISAELALSQKEEQSSNQQANPIPDDGSDLSLLLLAMVELFPSGTTITPTSDFFHDLGGHSLVAAKLVSKLRKESPKGSPLKQLGLQDIYIYRTADRIATTLSAGSVPSSPYDQDFFYEKNETFVDEEEDNHWPVSQRNYVLCGIAQFLALWVFFFIEAVSMLGPYLAFYAVLEAADLETAIAITYFVFVGIPPLRAIVGILGKWIVLGKAKPGEYPLYGVYYFRWWLAERFVALVDMVSIADTALLPALMRCMGSHVGNHCHIGNIYIGAAFDLVTIGDDVVMGKDAVLATSWVERGRLILAPVSIGSQVHFGSNSIIEGDSYIEEGGELGPLSMLPQGSHLPPGERWTGSPAKFREFASDVGGMRKSRPSEIRAAVMAFVMTFSSVFLLPIIVFAPQIPSLLLFDYVKFPGIDLYVQTAMVCVPAALVYMVLVFTELIVLRWLVLGKVVECTYRTTSVYFFRKWFVDRLMDISLVVLRPVYATLYVVPYLRSLGVKIGHRAEVSTARGLNFELTEIGEECFIADLVSIGNGEVRRNTVTLKKTKLNSRAFLGNASMVNQGSELAENTLVGVLSLAPDVPLKEGESCFGTPPVLMPARQCGSRQHDDDLLYTPSSERIALRLFVEGCRIVVPRILVTFGLGFGLQIFESGYRYFGLVPMMFLLPVFYLLFFGIPALFFTIFFKWTLIGRYHSTEWPLWSLNVWTSEFVTSIYETLTGPLFLELLTGTPFLPFLLRPLGMEIGSRVTLLSVDFTEFDMISIGDEAAINKHAGPQTHLFEDRVMKVGRVDLEKRSTLKPYSICLPGSRVGEEATLGSLSLVMKGETVPAGEAWEGAPIQPKRARGSGSGKSRQ